LINLEVGPQCEVVTFLIDSNASRSSLCLLPRGLIYFPKRMLVTGVKGERFSAKILQETDVYFQDRATKIQFLLVPEAGTNLFGRDLVTRLRINLYIKRDKILVSLNLLTPWAKRQIKPVVWAKDGNQGGLQVTPIKVQLKNTGEVVRGKQYPIPMEGRIGLNPVIEGLI
jgi:hypothetical protein